MRSVLQFINGFLILAVATSATATRLFAAEPALGQPARHWNIRYELPDPKTGKPQDVHVAQTWTPLNGPVTDETLDQIEALHRGNPYPVLFFEIEEDGQARKPAAADPNAEVKSALTRRGIAWEIFSLTRGQLETFKKSLQDIRIRLAETAWGKKWRNAYVEPSPIERQLGISAAMWRAGTAAWIWFTSPGVSPEVAVAMTLFSTAVTAVFSYYGRTVERLFWSKEGNPDDRVSKTHFHVRRQLFSLAFNALSSIAAYGFGAASLAGHARALVNHLLGSAGDAYFANMRYKVFLSKGAEPGSGSAFGWYGFLAFMPLSVVGLADFMGKGAVLVDVGFYEFKTTTLTMVTLHVGLATALLAAPETIRNLMRKLPENLGVRSAGLRTVLIESGTLSSCKPVLQPVPAGKPKREPAARDGCRPAARGPGAGVFGPLRDAVQQ